MKSYQQFLLSEADTSDATNVEQAICVAYNDLKGHDDPVAAAGIEPKNWTKVKKELRQTGKAVAKDLGNVGKVLIHSGSGSSKTYYAKGRDVTPKTDLFGDNNNRFSLKKAGESGAGAQLMSAKSGEASGVLRGAIAHFEANEGASIARDGAFNEVFKIIEEDMLAASRNDLNVEVRKGKNDFQKWYFAVRLKELKKKGLKDDKGKKYKDKPLLNHIKDELSDMGAAPTKSKGKNLIDGAMISRADFDIKMQQYIKSSVAIGDVKVSARHLEKVSPKELTKSALKTQIVDIIKTSMEAENWKIKIKEFLENNNELKKWLVYEAASGLYKFTGKASVGSKYTGGETAVANTMLVFHNGGVKKKEDVFPWSMANTALASNVSVDFKGGGRSKYPKLGIAAAYEPKGHPLFEESITSIINEEYESFQSQLLTEGYFSDLKDTIVTKVQAAAKYLWENIIKRVIQKMKEWAAKGITVLLEILGYEIEGEVSMATPSW